MKHKYKGKNINNSHLEDEPGATPMRPWPPNWVPTGGATNMNTWNKTTNWNTSLLKQNNRQWMGTEDNSPRSLTRKEALSNFSTLTYNSHEWKL